MRVRRNLWIWLNCLTWWTFEKTFFWHAMNWLHICIFVFSWNGRISRSFFPSIFHGEIGRERKLCLGSRVTLYVVLFFRFSLQIVKSWAGRTTSVRGNRWRFTRREFFYPTPPRSNQFFNDCCVEIWLVAIVKFDSHRKDYVQVESGMHPTTLC